MHIRCASAAGNSRLRYSRTQERALSASRCWLLPRRPKVSGAGPHLALGGYGFALECLFWGVDGESANLFQALCVLLVRGHEVVPGLDFCEGAFGPGLDGVQEADEEVDHQGPEVSLILRGVDA